MKNNSAVDFSTPSGIRKFFDTTPLGESIKQYCVTWTRALVMKRTTLCVECQDTMAAYDKALQQFCNVKLEFKRIVKGVGFVQCKLWLVANGDYTSVAEFYCDEYGKETITWYVS